MSPSLTTILIIVQFGFCLVISFLSLNRFNARDLTIKIIGIMFLVKCFGILQFVIPHALYLVIKTFPFDFIFITILYAVVFGNEYYKLFAVYLFIVVTLSLVLIFSGLHFFWDSILQIVCVALLSLYSLLYFYRLLRETPKHPLEGNLMFWVSAGVFTYNCGVVFLMMMASLLVVTSQTKGVINLLHHALSITSYSIMLIGLLVARKEEK